MTPKSSYRKLSEKMNLLTGNFLLLLYRKFPKLIVAIGYAYTCILTTSIQLLFLFYSSIQALVIIGTLTFALYAYYYFDHLHFNVTYAYGWLGYPQAQHQIGQRYLHGKFRKESGKLYLSLLYHGLALYCFTPSDNEG